MITLPGNFAVKVLQGKGLTLDAAERKLDDVRRQGFATVPSGTKTILVLRSSRGFTIE